MTFDNPHYFFDGSMTLAGPDPLPMPRHRDWQAQSKQEIEKTIRIGRRLDRARRGLPAEDAKPARTERSAVPVDTSHASDEMRDLARMLTRPKAPEPTTAARQFNAQEKGLMKLVPIVRALK